MVGALVVALLASTQPAAVTPQPTAIDGAATYLYKSVGEDQLRLHVFSPRDPGALPRPAIIFFFGGGWTNGSVTQFVPQATYLAKRGMVAIVADYRVFSRQGTSPFEAMADAKSAVRWTRSHAAQLGIDPNRIAAAGGSSGGHLALSAAVFDTFDEKDEDQAISSRPDALVLFNPAVDTTHSTPTLLRDRFGDRGRDGSPIHHLHSGLPPTLILHGMADATVPYTDVERFCTESKKLGNQCQLVGYEAATHGFFNPGRGSGDQWHRETLQEVDRFLTTIGYLRPRPTDVR